MVFSLRDFKSSLYGREQAQQNRFEIFLKCKLFTGESNRYVSLRAENLQFPGRNIRSAADENIYGPPRELPQGVGQYAALQATFLCNADMSEKRFFEMWMKNIYNPLNHNLNYYNNYIGELDIFQMGKGSNTVIPFNFLAFTGAKEEKTSYGVSIKEVWPKSIAPQDLNQASTELQRVTVELAYREWHTIKEEGVDDSLADKSLRLRGSDIYIGDDSRYSIISPKGVLYDILGKSGASPTAIATAGSAADIITGGIGNTIGKFVR